MSPAKLFSGVFGAVYLLVGIVGFGISGVSQESHQLFGLFNINAAHNVVHLLIGATGVIAFACGNSMSRIYAGIVGVVLAVVALAGFLPQPFLGILPIGGADIALHAGTAVLAGLSLALATAPVTSPARR